MKRIPILFFIISLLLVSCSPQKTNEKKEQPEQTETIKESKEIKTELPTNTKTMGTIHLTKADFLSKVANYETSPEEWKYLGDKPAIIDYYATWCGPCKVIAPILEELAAEYADEIYIYKIDVEKEPELAALFDVRSIPTLLFIPMDGMPQIAQGALPKDSFKKGIEEILLIKK